MKSGTLLCAAAAALLSLSLPALGQQQAGSAFTYQGQLKTSGASATGNFDMRFRLYDAASGGLQVGNTVAVTGVSVSGGLFSTSVDFGVNAFEAGHKRFLEIQVRPSGNGSYTTLSPRQELTPAPYSICSDRVSLPLLQSGSSSGGLLGTGGLLQIIQEGGGAAIVGQGIGPGAGLLGVSTSATGNAGRFINLSGSSSEAAVSARNDGEGWGIEATSHLGRAGSFEITNPSNPHIALYGYTAGTGHGVQGFSIGAGKGVGGYNNGTGNAGFFRVGNTNSSADAVYVETQGTGAALSVRSTTGPAVYARSSNNGPAIQTDGGGVRVTGAGVNTNTWVFVHQTNASNTSGTRTYLNNPHCNGKPNVIIMVSNAFNGGGVFPRPVAVGYDTGSSRWYLHDMENDEMLSGGFRFNIMIIAP